MPAVMNTVEQILATALDGSVVESNGVDVVVRGRGGGEPMALEVRWAGDGWPQDVRRAASGAPEPWPAKLVVVASRLSPGAIEWLRERGANWADAAGQARILGPGGLIVIREPTPRPAGRSQRFAWSRSALAIAEAILAEPAQPLRAARLGTETGWSTAQAAKVLTAFDGQRWTAKQGAPRGPHAYRSLIDPDGMLASWAAAATSGDRPARVAHRATDDLIGLLRDAIAPALDSTGAWAVSGWAGLELAAPFATTTPSLHFYVDEDRFAGPLTDAIERAGLRELDGGTITFWPAPQNTLSLTTLHTAVPVVSPPRLFADLESSGARGIDAAGHVKEQLIDPLHIPQDQTGDHG